jgi:hypothetical protein
MKSIATFVAAFFAVATGRNRWSLTPLGSSEESLTIENRHGTSPVRVVRFRRSNLSRAQRAAA